MDLSDHDPRNAMTLAQIEQGPLSEQVGPIGRQLLGKTRYASDLKPDVRDGMQRIARAFTAKKDRPTTIEDEAERRHYDPLVDLEARAAVEEAEGMLARPAAEFVSLPELPALESLIGPLADGEYHVFVGFSGGGKTSLGMSLLHYLQSAGYGVTYMGLEMQPAVLRLHWAVRRIAHRDYSYPVGDALKGKLRRAVERGDPVARQLYDELRSELAWQTKPEIAAQVRVMPSRELNLRSLHAALASATVLGHRIFILDHQDHLEDDGDGIDIHQKSAMITRSLERLAKDLGIIVISFSQCNNEVTRKDPIQQFQCPQPHMVRSGGLKRERCDSMVGIYRPMIAPPDVADLDRKERKEVMDAFRERLATARMAGRLHDLVQPNTMALQLMKDRAYGAEGTVAMCRVVNGLVRPHVAAPTTAERVV